MTPPLNPSRDRFRVHTQGTSNHQRAPSPIPSRTSSRPTQGPQGPISGTTQGPALPESLGTNPGNHPRTSWMSPGTSSLHPGTSTKSPGIPGKTQRTHQSSRDPLLPRELPQGTNPRTHPGTFSPSHQEPPLQVPRVLPPSPRLYA